MPFGRGGFEGYLTFVQNVLQTGRTAVMCMMFGLVRDAVQCNTITNSSVKKFCLQKKGYNLIFRFKNVFPAGIVLRHTRL